MLIFDRRLVRFYRDKASFYDKASNLVFSKVTDILLDKVSLFSTDTGLILNIGSRTDFFVKNLLQKKLILSEDQLIQCDISYHMIYSVQGKYKIVADEEALPFCNDIFDIVISNVSLHNVNNLLNVLLSIYSIIRKNGVFLAALFGNKTLYELKYSIIRAEMDFGIAPRVMPFINVEDVILLLQKSGYSNVVVDVNTIMVEYYDIYTLFYDLKKMGEGNVLYVKNKYPLTRGIIEKIFEHYKLYFSVDKVSIPATFEIITLKGSKM